MTEANALAPSPAPDARWIDGPAIDLVVGCALWSAPLLLLAGWSSGASTRTWAVGFYLLALAFNYPHYMATVYRAYRTRAEFAKYRIFTLHITALLGVLVVCSHVWRPIVPWIFTLYLTWSPWHYTGQNFGIAMMFARRNGAAPTPNERRALYAAFAASYLLLFVSFHTGPSIDPLIRSLNIPAAISSPARLVLLALIVVSGAAALVPLVARAGITAMLAPLTLVVTQCIWFVAPAVAQGITGAPVALTRYSSGVLAVMHSAQYLWITRYYARREAEAAPGGVWRPWSYAATLVAGGIALFVPGPWITSYLFQFDFTTSALIFTAVVNIHHFVLDGAVWKLRDGRIAALLIDPRRQAAATAADAGRAVRGWGRWLTSDRAPARRLRAAALVGLGVWAAVDQARFVLATNEDSPSALARAAALNPYDTSVRGRQARLFVNDLRYQDAYEIYRAPGAFQMTDQQARAAVATTAQLLARGWAARADRLDQLGQTEAAARAFHKAIALDESAGDIVNGGTDWFNFGQFLRSHGARPQLVMASLLEAEALLDEVKDERLDLVRSMRVAVERDHPDAAADARAHPAATLAAARTY